jgi:hypothetical protein
MIPDDGPSLDELKALYYRWWTVKAGLDFVKLGPLTICWYRWFDSRWRVSWQFNFGPEHIVVGGPLDMSDAHAYIRRAMDETKRKVAADLDRALEAHSMRGQR